MLTTLVIPYKALLRELLGREIKFLEVSLREKLNVWQD